MNAGTAYLLLVAFAALSVFLVAEPLVDQVGTSLAQSAELLRQAAHPPPLD
jgi:hypothetical protein